MPPCGHVAGIFARTDARVGVFKAPANEEYSGCSTCEARSMTASRTAQPGRRQCLRAFPGRGIRVWGARTLSAAAPNWRYVNVRPPVPDPARWIDLNMAWAAFEPNDAATVGANPARAEQLSHQAVASGALKGDADRRFT